MQSTRRGRAIRLTKKRQRGPSLTIKVPEAAELAGGGERAIRKAIAEGRIPTIPFGRAILISRPVFLRWLETSGGTSDA
jgi:excisionase family DNA binding protein